MYIHLLSSDQFAKSYSHIYVYTHIFLESKIFQNCTLNFYYFRIRLLESRTFPGGSDGKASAYNVGDPGSIPGLRRSPGEGNGNPL